MGWFDRKPPPTPPQAATSATYSIQNILDLLDAIGYLRLAVADPEMKLTVSTIAWETPGYMSRKSTNGNLGGAAMAELQEHLQMIKSVLTKYIEIQNNPGAFAARNNPQVLMKQGLDSLQAFAQKITDTTTIATNADITGYVVDNRILNSL